ncbi:hypothetical protein O181_066632 [Austropuccinia psidii MF-1]|uniref:Uncharacterized protein n=1 Tax=Austropuccinia psidii MF-1 TaxID=1389203 RepID=A0A9Q3I4H2_9BASI|nr:hypothetical protein [Austropuccinia psidii MF-1]
MRRNLDIVMEDPGKWLALELSGMNKEDEGESPQRKSKMDMEPPEAHSSGISEDYLNLLHKETMYISDTKKYLLSEEPKNNIIKPLAKTEV